MMKRINVLLAILFLVFVSAYPQDIPGADEAELKISGNLTTDERILLKNENDWAWNENRLTVNFDRKISGYSKFHSEVWLRNIGLPDITRSADLYNKGIVDPYNLEIREAYLQLSGFLTKNLDVTIGRQRIVWGTADKLNPSDVLNPYDMEDLLDFGRHRGSDAINLVYFFNNILSIQAVYMPFFQPANTPVGIFSDALVPEMNLPAGMTLKGLTDTILMPKYNIKESSTTGIKIKGYLAGFDLSLGYVRGFDGIPFNTKNKFIPVDTLGGIKINSQASFIREHIICADFATSIAGIGFWGEAAVFIPDDDVVMTTDMSAFYPQSPVPVTADSIIADRPFARYIIGADYNFFEGSYINIQYLHGFIHERGKENLNDYFFFRYEKKFFNEKLKLAPVSGAIIISDWKNVGESYTLAYLPQATYQATPDVEITLSAALFNGKGDNLFSRMNDYDMLMFNLKYSF